MQCQKLGNKEKIDLIGSALTFKYLPEVLKADESSFFSSERGKRQGKVQKEQKWQVWLLSSALMPAAFLAGCYRQTRATALLRIFPCSASDIPCVRVHACCFARASWRHRMHGRGWLRVPFSLDVDHPLLACTLIP